MLDKIDKKILKLLESNSKIPVKQIAKEVRVSREVAAYRIKNLENKKIIKKFIAKINQSIFSGGAASVCIKLNYIDENRKNDIEKFFQEQRNINWFAELAGRYDYTLTIFFKNTNDMGNAIDEINIFLGKDLISTSFSIYLKEYKFSRTQILEVNKNLSVNDSLNTEIEFSHLKINEYKLDNNDLKIIKELSINSKQTFKEIGNKINLNDETIRQKIKKLENNKIVLGYTIVLDAYLCGFEGYYINIKLDNYTSVVEKTIKKEILTNPNISFAAKMTGNYNLVLGMYAKDRREFKTILDNIKKVFNTNIIELNIDLMLNEKKEVYVPEYFFQRIN